MQKYRIILPVIAIVLLVAWYAFRPERLFVNRRVHEELPTAQAANSPARLLASGKFHSGAHPTSGTAAVYQLADGTRVLRFTDFKTSNGPDVHVYLVAADDASDSESVTKAGFVDLASIKAISVTRITALAPMCISRNIALSPCCVSGSVSISAPRLSQRIGWPTGEVSAGLRPVKLRDVE
jgi:Electron transfer DM13